MNDIEPFDLADTSLVQGVTLIEASAGTGKTYTIAGIILRLVLELRVPINEILAVTYTVAATAELRDRVRRRLHDALETLRRGESQDEITGRFLASGDVAQGIRDLNLAVQNFDEAQIFTIHGFCQRVLRDNAFESGLLFEMELLADPTPIFEEVAHDFWRTQFYESSPLLSRLALSQGRSPADWTALLHRLRNHPDLVVIPPRGDETCAQLLGSIETSFAGVIDEWRRSGDRIHRLLAEDEGLSRDKSKSHCSADGLAEMVSHLGELCSDLSKATPSCLSAISKLSSSEIERCTKPTGTAPAHPFFDLCEEFRLLTLRYFHELTHEFIAFARRELPLRKERRNVLTYDDFATRLRDALESGMGSQFAAIVGGKFRAVLLDEFQDTDPIQYEIFRRLFAGGAHYLIYIGDPKQAIYGFRGADVFTYLRAAGGADHKFTLGTNWRSEKALIAGVNSLFGNVAKPFLVEQIAHRPVSPPLTPKKSFVEMIEGTSEAPLRFRWLDSPGNQDKAEREISQAVVADIARLKASGAKLGNRPLAFSDIAVLVRSNAQAANLQELLRASGIKSVLKTGHSVFRTREGCEVLRLLEGIADPGRTTALKTALVTRFFGLNAAELVAFDADETPWQHWLDRFLGYRTLWESGCFIATFRHVLVDQKVRERLVQWPGGERALTNFLHLAELLHQAETEQRLTPGGLCAWLRQQRGRETGAADEDQLRLESDDDAVLLSTIHKSKGLEYPVVFCPFLWKAGDGSRRSEILYHDPSADNRLTLDLRGKKEVPEHDERTGMERMAESLRVLYVALTRAQNRCYVYAGEISGFEASPLSYLLGALEPLTALQSLVQNSPEAMSISLVAMSGPGHIEEASGESHGAESLQARPFRGAISQTRMIASFTGLTSGRSEEEPDRDAVLAVVDEPVQEEGFSDLAAFDRGVGAGVFFHDVLEHLDFTAPDSVERLVKSKLITHGMSGHPLRESVSAQLRKLLDVALAPGVTLRRVTAADRLNEVEFTHPIVSLRPEQLQRVFVEHAASDLSSSDFSASLGRLQFRPVEGFMRGFIDCLFQLDGRYYLVDWKSNWLGDRLSDYDEPGMRACMLQHSYFLQYHLYTIATDLYLSQRVAGYDYDQHFGGVFYVFIRGIDPMTPGRGIFRDKPDAGLVRALRRELLGGES